MAFDKPGTAQGFAPTQHPEWQGRLFLIFPTNREEVQFPDKQPGDLTTVITADVAIVDLPDPLTGGPFTVLLGVSISSKALIPQLAKYVGTGTAALGRLNPRAAQPGKNPAWALDDYTDADAALATPVDAASAQWRGRVGQPSTPPVAQPAAPLPPPPVAPVAAPAPPVAGLPAPVAAPIPAPVPAGPWYADPANAALVQALRGKGYPDQQITMLPDLATAQLAAQG